MVFSILLSTHFFRTLCTKNTGGGHQPSAQNLRTKRIQAYLLLWVSTTIIILRRFILFILFLFIFFFKNFGSEVALTLEPLPHVRKRLEDALCMDPTKRYATFYFDI